MVSRRTTALEFTSVALFQNLCAPPHRDLNNSSGFPSCIFPCSSFRRGECGSKMSQARRRALTQPTIDKTGRLLQLTGATLSTAPWSGTRVVLAAFVIARFELLSNAHRLTLQDLCFRRPVADPHGRRSPITIPASLPSRTCPGEKCFSSFALGAHGPCCVMQTFVYDTRCFTVLTVTHGRF